MNGSKFYRADKRLFSIGGIVRSAGEFLEKNPLGSNEIECVFEKKRPSHLPPRATCLYVFPLLADAKKHWSKMSEGKLYEVTVKQVDILFQADMSHVDEAFRSKALPEKIESCANLYWSGTCSAKPVIEALVRQAHVSDILSIDEGERKAHLKSWAISTNN